MSDYSDYAPLQRPSGAYRSGTNTGGYGSDQNSSGRYGDAPVRVADAPTSKKEPRTRKKAWKEVKDGPRQKTAKIYILFYFSDISKTFTFDTFLQRLHGSSDSTRWFETSDFISNGIDIVRKSNSETVWADLGSALYEPGAVVIYWGHSERAKGSKKARNLRPRRDPDDGSSDVSIGKLGLLLKTANAKSFIIAACATDGCIGRVQQDTAIIATDSGKDLLTNSLNWANALEKFLKKFIAGSSISDCIDEANKEFPGSKDADDRFVLASGLGSMTKDS